MKKTFEIDWAANKNYVDNVSVVAFAAVSGDEQYGGTVVVNSTDDAVINDAFDWHLADHIRLAKEDVND